MTATAIGTVTVSHNAEGGTATLRTDRTWAFDGDPFVCQLLRNCTFLIDLDADRHGPADGPFGPAQLNELAEMWPGSTVALADLPGEPAGTIY